MQRPNSCTNSTLKQRVRNCHWRAAIVCAGQWEKRASKSNVRAMGTATCSGSREASLERRTNNVGRSFGRPAGATGRLLFCYFCRCRCCCCRLLESKLHSAADQFCLSTLNSLLAPPLPPLLLPFAIPNPMQVCRTPASFYIAIRYGLRMGRERQ